MSIVSIFDYITGTKIGGAIGFVIGALVIYGIFRLFIKIIDYIVFKKLLTKIIDIIYDDEKEDNTQRPVSSYHHEDEQSQKKDKKRDQIREAERMNNMENDMRGWQLANRRKNRKRIVAIDRNSIKGYWTKRVFYKDILPKYQNIDINVLNEKGYHQAKELQRIRQRQIGNHQKSGRYR